MNRASGLTTQKNYRSLLYLYSFLIVLIGIVLSGVVLLWTLPSDLGEGYHNVQATLRAIQQVLFVRIAVAYSVTTLVVLLAMAILHLLYSHRIAGPAYRMTQDAARIAEGDLSRTIRFRQSDNLLDMADSINSVVMQFRDQINQIQQTLTQIEQQTDSLDTLIRSNGDNSAIQQTFETISQDCNSITDKLAEIRS